MGKTLKHNIMLRQSLTSPVHSFVAGEELPEWAEALVGKHVFEEAEAAPDFRRVKKTGLPSAPPVVEEAKELEVPAGNASRASWAKFLTEAGVEYPEDCSRDDLKDIAAKALPELEI